MGGVNSTALATHVSRAQYLMKYWLQVWVKTWLWMSNLDKDTTHIYRLFTDWKYRQSFRHGMAMLGLNILRIFFRLLNLLLVPHVFVRYLLATSTLHILYEITKRIRRVMVILINDFTVRGRRINTLRSQLRNAKSYHESQSIGTELDHLEGLDVWREDPESNLYSYQRMILKTKMYQQMQDDNDITGLMFYLRAGLLRKHWGLGNPKLYHVSHVGTKQVITKYMNTTVGAMQKILDAQPQSHNREELSIENKLAFFNETRHAFGRSALMLSGGGAMGIYHAGVIKALAEQQMIPTIISGASAGSIVAAMVGVRTDDEILQALYPENVNFQFFGTKIDVDDLAKMMPSIFKKLKCLHEPLMEKIHVFTYLIQRWIRDKYILDINVLKECVSENTGNYTFREAYDRTGRIINITVSAHQSSEYPQLLNYLTAPNVLVWSACIASCAIPGIFSPVELFAKDKYGLITPYHPEGLKWTDGSVECDLPMERLSELFNVNLFIVSQVNIHYKILSGYQAFGSGSINDMLAFLKKQMKSYLKNIMYLGFHTSIFKVSRVAWIPLLTQQYEGDVTICASESQPCWRMLANLLQNPSKREYEAICLAGERATWRHICRIRTMCQIEFELEKAVRILRSGKAQEDVKSGRLGRVPSFYTSYSDENLNRKAGVSRSTLVKSAPSSSSNSTFPVVNTPIRRNKSIHVAGAIMTELFD